MPDHNGDLTSDEKDKFVLWLESHQKNGHPVCPVTKDDDWTVGDHMLVSNIVMNDSMVGMGSTQVPVVYLVCDACGYLMFFSAVAVGLIAGADLDG